MPERKFKRYFEVDSSEIQGEGSFVKFRRLNYSEMRPLLDKSETLLRIDIVAASIVGWNWVDDNGAPIPLPENDPDMMKTVLVQQEINWLIDALTSATEQVNPKN